MTTHELAHKLLEGPNLMVTLRGYEGGVNEICNIMKPQLIHLDYHDTKQTWYYGKHEYHQDISKDCYYCDKEHPEPTTLAINLSAGVI